MAKDNGKNSVVTGRKGGKVSTKLFCAILFPNFSASQSLIMSIVINCVECSSPESYFKGKEYLRIEKVVLCREHFLYGT